MKQTAFSVRPYRDAKRPLLRFVVTGPPINGKRWRRFFESKGEAEAFLQMRKVERENHGSRALEFPEALRVEAREVADALTPYGWTLRDALNFCLPHLKARHRSCPVERMVAELMADKKREGTSDRYRQDLKNRLGTFARAFNGKLAAEVTEAEVEAWLFALKVAPVTRNNFRRMLVVLFNSGQKKGYCAGNPALGITKAKVPDKPAGILTPEQAAGLLEHASGEVLPYLALGMFAGLRVAELERLDWREVDLETGHVEITAAKAKSARRRIVTVHPNLAAWLAPYARPAGPVCPPNARAHAEAARDAAGIVDWPPNALRHSFASYHLAHFNDAAALALQMGHTNNVLIFAHYRQLVRPKDAARFWQLRPATADNVVAMKAA